MDQLSYPCMTTGKTIAFSIPTCVSKVMSQLFNTLSRFVTAFLPRNKRLLISWLQSLSVVILVFWILSFKPAFSLSSFILIKRLFSSALVSAIRVILSAYLWLLIFLPAVLIPACDSSSPAFHMLYFAYKFKKQGDNIQPSHTPFLILNQSFVPYLVLTVASWHAYR